MTVASLIEKLQTLEPTKSILPQLIAEDGTVWNIWMEVNDIPKSSFVQFKLHHSDLKTLPSADEINNFRREP